MTSLADTQSRFADRLFLTGGRDPGDEAIAVPAERLAVYQELVRRNYASMLQFAFTSTFRLLDAEIAAGGAGDLPASTDALVRRFLEVSPAAQHSTRHIADVFRGFLAAEHGALLARRPEITDLLDLERAELGALYAWDDPGRSPDATEVAALASAPVEDFLALRVLRAPSAAALRLAHRATVLRHAYAHGAAPEPAAFAGPERVAVTRDPATLEVAFTVFDEAPFRALEALGSDAAPVEDVAAAWIGALDEEDSARDDAWKLRTFAGALLTGLSSGFLRLA